MSYQDGFSPEDFAVYPRPEVMADRIAKLESELERARKLLAIARCPDENCDGEGTVAVPVGEGEWGAMQCQWCHEAGRVPAPPKE